MIDMTTLNNGFIVMAAGISGVFLVLILFYFLIRILRKLFPEN